jgi:hypothetical protein
LTCALTHGGSALCMNCPDRTNRLASSRSYCRTCVTSSTSQPAQETAALRHIDLEIEALSRSGDLVTNS